MTDAPPELLAAMLADPEDDAPRLACADWFTEHGRPDRGTFVELQVRHADDPDARSEATALRLAHPEWLSPLDMFDLLPDSEVTFARGFPAAVRLGDPLPRRWRAFLAANSLVEELTIAPSRIEAHSPLDRVPAMPNLRRLFLPADWWLPSSRHRTPSECWTRHARLSRVQLDGRHPSDSDWSFWHACLARLATLTGPARRSLADQLHAEIDDAPSDRAAAERAAALARVLRPDLTADAGDL